MKYMKKILRPKFHSTYSIFVLATGKKIMYIETSCYCFEQWKEVVSFILSSLVRSYSRDLWGVCLGLTTKPILYFY